MGEITVCFSRSADGLKWCASLDDPSLSANAQLILLPDSSFRSAEECCTQWMLRSCGSKPVQRLVKFYYRIAKKSKIHAFPAEVCLTVGVKEHICGDGYGNMMRKYGL
ncbi:hypothetical protein JHK85_045706 [Glycine max]|nr:hypothetical protein JHK85_045706 [Glycine max]